MNTAKRLLLVLCIWACALSLCAQSLEITRTFEIIPSSSVSALYKNEFGKWEKPLLDDTFPYALIRIGLEGNEREVTAAKQKLGLYLGRLHMPLEKLTDKPNELLFLIPAGAGHVEIQCGDGCKNQTVIDLPRLQSNKIYSGQVHYMPAEDFSVKPDQPKVRQFFTFRVTPANAVVTVWENGNEHILPMKEGGVANKVFEHGTYRYRISADRYYSDEGSFTVSDTEREKTITLRPQFGYLTISGDATAQGAYVFATNQQTGGMMQLGTIPLMQKEMETGLYTIRIQQEKYKDYSTTVVVEEGKTSTLYPVLEANYAQITMITQSGADIILDGNKLGTTKWTGTLEIGEYTIETRQIGHRPAYTTLIVSPQTMGKTVALKSPTPISGSLIVDGTPSDVIVYVDGKQVGVTPVVVNQLLVGERNVVLEKEGYEREERRIIISENEEQMLEYNLSIATRKTNSSSEQSRTVSKKSNKEPQAVDLGLPSGIKWADRNVGASKPEAYGDYLAWGEVRSKSVYSWSTYKHCEGSSETLTKYNYSANNGLVDGKRELDAIDDAATAKWGGVWRMPTDDEFTELRTYCNWTWTIQNRVAGYQITSKTNGNSIFLPAGGDMDGENLYDEGSYCYYWSRSLHVDNPYDAYNIGCYNGNISRFGDYRYFGLLVRPVCP